MNPQLVTAYPMIASPETSTSVTTTRSGASSHQETVLPTMGTESIRSHQSRLFEDLTAGTERRPAAITTPDIVNGA